ncbi:MAG: hypothetical protein KJ052_14945 [Candidatus Hydrogenedentes bacterium]|nr:hypothetical protein [Candidatus Hydrogenedentota bacterium]
MAWIRDGFRRVARRLWKVGVDGVYLFNFPAPRQNDKEPLLDLLKELGAANTIGEDDSE